MAEAPYNIKDAFQGTPTIMRKIHFFPKLILENWILREELGKIRHRLSEIEERIPEEKVIVLRDITKDELRQEIRDLFQNRQTLYYSDIAEELGVNLKSVVDVCLELQENKEIVVDENVLA